MTPPNSTQPPSSSETPLTDAWVYNTGLYDPVAKCFSPKSQQVVLADFARSLEKQLNEAKKLNRREHDLVRQQRSELHRADLITDDEYFMLASEKGAVKRLEDYDKLIEQHQLDARKARALSWLENQLGLHTGVDLLYVIDGYHVSLTHDGSPRLAPYSGDDLLAAIESAMSKKSK